MNYGNDKEAARQASRHAASEQRHLDHVPVRLLLKLYARSDFARRDQLRQMVLLAMGTPLARNDEADRWIEAIASRGFVVRRKRRLLAPFREPEVTLTARGEAVVRRILKGRRKRLEPLADFVDEDVRRREVVEALAECYRDALSLEKTLGCSRQHLVEQVGELENQGLLLTMGPLYKGMPLPFFCDIDLTIDGIAVSAIIGGRSQASKERSDR